MVIHVVPGGLSADACNRRRSRLWRTARLPKAIAASRCTGWPISCGSRILERCRIPGSAPPKNDPKPHLTQTWYIGQIDAAFLAAMEQVLSLYALPYDSVSPAICCNGRLCCLIGDERPPLPLQPGQVTKEHDASVRHGLCRLPSAIELQTGRRIGWWRPSARWPRTSSSVRRSLLNPDAVKIRGAGQPERPSPARVLPLCAGRRSRRAGAIGWGWAKTAHRSRQTSPALTGGHPAV